MIIAMLIVGMLATLAIGGYMRARGTAEATKNREQIAATYQAIARCKTENDGFYASYADLKGSYCLSSLTVKNNTKLCQLGSSAADGCNVTGGSRCWNENARSVQSFARALWASPAHSFTSGDERGYRVGLCTFSGLSSGATTSATENAADSQYIRVSATRNGHIYYFVEEPSGFHTYIGKDSDDDGRPDTGSCLRRTSGSGPDGNCS
jgi:type II secretory pathway pseudopilin PulG